MDDITELERRIAAAFDRMDQGLDALARAQAASHDQAVAAQAALQGAKPQGAAVDPAQTARPDAVAPDAVAPDWVAPDAAPADAAPQLTALLRALELAKASNSDWAERYSALQEQMSAQTLAMASEIARLTQELADAQHARTRSEDAASMDAQTAPSRDDEIDDLTARLAAQEAELEALRSARAQEAAELGDIISALTPLVEEASHV